MANPEEAHMAAMRLAGVIEQLLKLGHLDHLPQSHLTAIRTYIDEIHIAERP